jgi:hypothetical protein
MANFKTMVGSESRYCKENIVKASTCHTERRKTKRFEMEVEIMAL